MNDEGNPFPRAGRGLAPIPDEPSQHRRRGAVPPVPEQVRRPATAAKEQKTEKVAPKDRWALRYQGNAGVQNDVNYNVGIPLEPVVELDTIKPLTVLFWQDRQYPQPPNEHTERTYHYYVFDATAQDGPGIQSGRVRLQEQDESQPSSAMIYVEVPPTDGNLRQELMQTTQRSIELRWGDSYMEWTIDSWTAETDGGIDYVALSVLPVGDLVNESDGPLEDAEALQLVLKGLKVPNAAVRARVTYTAGKLVDVSFDCDWVGGFTLHASRLELSRVTYAPDTAIPYVDAPVDIAATIVANAPPTEELLQLTVPVEGVEIDSFREVLVPPLARKVNLLLRYGNEGAPGDAPLGQLFVAFVGRHDRSLSYIDAMSAREALFGVGLLVPAGATKVMLSNRSADASVELGLLWHLGS